MSPRREHSAGRAGTGEAGRRLHRKLLVTIHKVENVPVVELKYKTTLALCPLTISPQELCEGWGERCHKQQERAV